MKKWRVFVYYFNEQVYEVAEKQAKIKPTRWLRWFTEGDNVSHCRLEVVSCKS